MSQRHQPTPRFFLCYKSLTQHGNCVRINYTHATLARTTCLQDHHHHKAGRERLSHNMHAMPCSSATWPRNDMGQESYDPHRIGP